MLAAYHAALFVVPALILSAAYRQFAIPLWILWPIVWVTVDALSLLGPFAAPLGHFAGAVYEQLWMLQILDLGGTLMVSFPIAMVQGLLADVWIAAVRSRDEPEIRWKRLPWAGASASVGIWIAIAIYGHARLDEIEQSLVTGPRVAVIQPDVPFVRGVPPSYDPDLHLERMELLTEAALSAHSDTDLVLWPEALDAFPLESHSAIYHPFDSRIENWIRGGSADAATPEQLAKRWKQWSNEFEQYATRFHDWASGIDIPILFGMLEKVPTEAGVEEPFVVRNVIAEIGRGTQLPAVRQAKVKLYPLGEYVPWEGSQVEWLLDRWLSPNARIRPGQSREIYPIGNGREPAAISICSEILSSQESGVFLRNADGTKAVRYVLNPSNEGSFLRNQAQRFTLASARFRAIEARVGVARSCNTGISGFVSPTGQFYGLVTNSTGQSRSGRGAPELSAIDALMEYRRTGQNDPDFVANVNAKIAQISTLRAAAGIEGWSSEHLFTSPETTLYQRWGQWVGWSVGVALLGLAISLVVFTKR